MRSSTLLSYTFCSVTAKAVMAVIIQTAPTIATLVSDILLVWITDS